MTPLSRLTLGPTACLPIGRKKLYLPRPIDLGGRDTVPPAASGQWASPATVLGVFRSAATQPFCKRPAEPVLTCPTILGVSEGQHVFGRLGPELSALANEAAVSWRFRSS